MNMLSRIKYMREALMVRRYHQRYTAEIDTVGKHSAGVALFCQLIHPECRKNLLVAALHHDLGEAVTGDIPSPAKRAMSKSALAELDKVETDALIDNGLDYNIDQDEEILLKICDLCDGLAFCTEELTRGNISICSTGNRYCEYLNEFFNKHINDSIGWHARARVVVTVLTQQWRKYHE